MAWMKNHADEYRWPLDGAGTQYLRVWQGGGEEGWLGAIVIGARHQDVLLTGPHPSSEAARDAVYCRAAEVLIIMDAFTIDRWATALAL